MVLFAALVLGGGGFVLALLYAITMYLKNDDFIFLMIWVLFAYPTYILKQVFH